MTITQFIRERAGETYPEPISAGHLAITEQMLPSVCRLIPLGGMVLDVGCGQGPALKWFKENGYNALGITTNAEDLQACESAGYEVERIDMHDMLGYVQRAFDMVWARHVLEHSVAPMYVLHEFWRVLKPGGILYVEVPGPDTPCQHETNPNHYSVMGWRMWACLLDKAGFEPVESKSISIKTPAGDDTYYSFIFKKP